MALLVLGGDITNAHQIDEGGVDRLTYEAHTLTTKGGNEVQNIWEVVRTDGNGMEHTCHLVVNVHDPVNEIIKGYAQTRKGATA